MEKMKLHREDRKVTAPAHASPAPPRHTAAAGEAARLGLRKPLPQL